jgi:NAD(P)-dependent dehydrogenase (short-subunit alcohol dehydrogenase family)
MAKSVLITGCSEGGMGDYLARDFHKRGFRVFATARNLKKVEHLKALGLDVLALDVTSEESISAAVKDVKAITGGTLNFLVNNSGSGKLLFYPAYVSRTNTNRHVF